MGNKFQDFDNQPLNMVPLNTGLTVIGILKGPQKVLKINPWIEIERKFYLCGQICYLISKLKETLSCLWLDQAKTEQI